MQNSFSVLLFAVVLMASVASLAQPAPPRVERVLDADSVVVAGSADVWRMRYLEADAFENPWVEVEDPYGGRIHIPSKYYLAVASDLTAFVEGTMLRSVFFVRRPLMLPVALIFLVGLVTVVAFPVGVYRRRLRRESERRRHADEVRRRLTESQEAERLRLAQDLHDGPVQDLHALRMRLSLLARPSAANATLAPVSEPLGEVVEEIQRVIRSLRGVSEDLRPPALAPFGLAAALGAFADRFRRTHPSIHVALDLDDDGQALPERVRLALFRIAQEAMNNAAKHGRPSHIAVALQLDDDRILLSVRDDGRGYRVPDDLRTLGRDGHYGLLGMVERADSIGAELHIESDPAGTEPTEVRATVRRGNPRRRTLLRTR
ncbi:MAG: sensor histidine kinase [Rhodothermales bacterium]